MPAANERFGASGGADSSDREQVTASFALVQTSPIPPPDAKPPSVACKRGDSAAETRKNEIINLIIII